MACGFFWEAATFLAEDNKKENKLGEAVRMVVKIWFPSWIFSPICPSFFHPHPRFSLYLFLLSFISNWLIYVSLALSHLQVLRLREKSTRFAKASHFSTSSSCYSPLSSLQSSPAHPLCSELQPPPPLVLSVLSLSLDWGAESGGSLDKPAENCPL